MSSIPCMAVVLEGGLVQAVVLEDWPQGIAPPRIVVVDYDIEGADDDELTPFTIGADRYEVACHCIEPTLHEADIVLSPRALLEGAG